MLIAIACFLSVLSLILGAYWFFVLREETKAKRTLSRRLNPTRAGANIVNPGPDEELLAGDQVLLLGKRAQLEAARRYLLDSTPGSET